MTTEFNEFYKKIGDKLRKYEFIRIFLLALVIILEAALVIGLVCLYFEGFFEKINNSSTAKIIFYAALFGAFIHWRIKKEFECHIKSKIMGEFLACFDDYKNSYWQLGESVIDKDSLERAKVILPKFNDRYSDDNFWGEYKNLSVKISEQRLKSGCGVYSGRVFHGLLIEYRFYQTTFPAEIIIRDHGIIPPKNLQKVKLEDTEFSKMFDVYSNDQIESRFVLTTAFMEKLKTLKTLFKAKGISVYIRGINVYIAVDLGRDTFDIAKLSKEIDDREELETMYNQFDFILKISDILHFTK